MLSRFLQRGRKIRPVMRRKYLKLTHNSLKTITVFYMSKKLSRYMENKYFKEDSNRTSRDENYTG